MFEFEWSYRMGTAPNRDCTEAQDLGCTEDAVPF